MSNNDHRTQITRTTPRGEITFWQDGEGDVMETASGAWHPEEYKEDYDAAFDAWFRAHVPEATDLRTGKRSRPFASAMN